MAGAFSQIDLSRLAPPQVVEALDFEQILGAMLADLRARDPAFSALTEADPAFKILEVAAYRELLMRSRINDVARGVMVAYAGGADLDQIAANYGVARLVIRPADTRAVPPVPAVLEADDDLRTRITLSLEGYTTAGSRGSYVFHALSASGDVQDVGVTSLTPGTVNVVVLSRTGSGAAPPETLAAVVNALNAEEVRPLCDTVDVQSATIVEYRIEATLTVFSGAGQEEVRAAAVAAAEAYAQVQRRLGRDITRSGVFAALHQPGVQNVQLVAPAADIVNGWNQAPHCTEISVTVGGVGE
ncbi:MAG: baseplate J/gp47 family protein [Lautropia sp.]|nr:baseplate J/gp47 family protein [Lautropia sp.]